MMATPPNIPTILIVDDDAANREAMARLLEHAGYRSLSAGDVPTARRILVEARPDLLITDVRLEAYNGLQLIAMAPTPIPAIVVTGYADPSIEADARRLGAEYLLKPLAPAALLELIARMLGCAKPGGGFMGTTRRAPRRRLTSPVSVRVGQQLGRVVEVGMTGLRLELHGVGDTKLSDPLVLHIVPTGLTVPVRVIWKRRQDPSTWVCGASVAPDDQARWEAFVVALS